MQGNGLKIGATVALLLLSGWYLFPTFQNLSLTRQLNSMTPDEQADYRAENLQQIRSVQERSMKLGLDLQGGMHVTLEVRVDALIRELATDRDAAFDSVLAAASARADDEDIALVNAFVSEFETRDADARLSRYFRDDDASITRRSTNQEVSTYLDQEATEAIDRAIEIIRQRIDRFGVTEPSIQRQGTSRIVVELPGIDDEERVRRLLRGTARLEFRLMPEPQDVARSAQDLVAYFEDTGDPSTTDTTATPEGDATEAAVADATEADASDTSAVEDLLATDDLLAPELEAPTNQLLALMQPLPYGPSVVFGQVLESDTAAVNELLARADVRQFFPRDMDLAYDANPVGVTESGAEVYDLIAVNTEAELVGDAIVDASVEFDQATNQPRVAMAMDSEGARTWARVTGANVGKSIAIVLDGVVYSYPRVEGRIVGGNSTITGLESREEASDIVTILKSGALPAPVEIVEER
ncbi:MAG: protein translocase subunit SecD, partial [Bacteroidota bacterium]